MSEECIPVFLKSLSPGSLKQYNSSFSKWWRFCIVNRTNFFRPSLNTFLEFLNAELLAGASYHTLNCHRSALKLVFDIEDPGNLIKRFLKGSFRIRPVFPKYNQTWDPQVVLNYLSSFPSLDTIKLTELTFKLITLMALITSHRIQTFSVIKLSNIRRVGDSVRIAIDAFIKTSAPNRPQPVLLIPRFSQKPELCVASLLEKYIEVTRVLRGDIDELFITHKKPHHRASAQTLSRWIRSVLKNAGIDTSMFSGYSTRHASTSAALSKGLDIETIRKTAGWTPGSNTFAKFYCRPLTDDSLYAKKLLLT